MTVTALSMNIGMSTFYNPSLQAFLWIWIGIGTGAARTVARFDIARTAAMA